MHGQKTLVYEGGIKVPAVLKWPGKFTANKRIHSFVHATDWFPTLLAACGLTVPEGLKLDGQNVLDILTGSSRDYGARRCWQWNRYEPVKDCNIAVRDGKWKLVRPPIPEAMEMSVDDIKVDKYYKANVDKVSDIRPPVCERILSPVKAAELYNLEDDPFEENNLAAKMPELVRKLSKDMMDWFLDVDSDRKIVITF